jgi:hypothetical protein
VRWTFELPAMTRVADARGLERKLAGVAGVRQVRAESERSRVRVQYDIRVCDYKGLERVLEDDAGFVPLGNWWVRLKSNWYQYSDTTGRDKTRAQCSAKTWVLPSLSMLSTW